MPNQNGFIIEDSESASQMRHDRYCISAQGVEALKSLQQLVDDPTYNTDLTYRSAKSRGFVERHLQYLSTHPMSNLQGYISNLKLMTRVSRAKHL